MRNMSYAMTTDQVRKKEKWVTRRFGWWFLKPGDLVQPVVKCMGLKKGEKMKKIGKPIRIISTRREPLKAMLDEPDATRAEGFPDMTSVQFVMMLCKHYKVTPDEEVNRIEFEYT